VINTVDNDVRVRKASKFGGGTYLALTGWIEEDRHYSIKKIGNKIIIEDVQDFISA
jgi:hypothetical protein